MTCACKQAGITEFVTSTMDEPWKVAGEMAGYDSVSKNAAENMVMDTLFINSEVTEQVLDGFGVSFSELSARSLGLLSETDRSAILDELFTPGKGANFIINRCPIGANDFSFDWYSYDEIDGDFEMSCFSIDRDTLLLIPLIKSALERNPEMTLWSTPWCPPTWMKRNHHYAMVPARVNDLPEEGRGHEGEDMFIQEDDYFEAYSLYFQKYIEAYRNQGINISMVMPQNEPNSAQNFPSCCWTSAGLCRFLSHLCPKMSDEGIDVYFGTCERPNPALIDTVLTNPNVGKYIKGVGFQWAGRSALPVIRSKYKGLKLVQTEQECGDGRNDWKGAAHSWELLKHYLGNGVNIYDYWNLALTESEPSNWKWFQNSLVIVNQLERSYRFSIEYYLLKHFSHYVLPGAKVISVPQDIDALAFKNENGSIVVVAANLKNTANNLTIVIDGKATAVFLEPESFNSIIFK